MDLQKRIESLTPEQRERARDLASPEEILEFAKAEGFEITDEELEALSGGKDHYKLPNWTFKTETRMS